MPELPEVETVRKSLLTFVKGLEIKDVTVLYPKLIENQTPEDFATSLIGEKILDISRRGKFLIFQLSHYDLISHLRMEGKYFYLKEEAPLDKHTHLLITFTNHHQLRYHDVRKFGRMALVKKGSALTYKSLVSLGPEPFGADFQLEAFKKAILKSSKEIKPHLLDQKAVVGLGNIYVDEVLWQSKIHPMRKSNSLTDEEIQRLYENIPLILKKAIDSGGSTIKSYHTVNGKDGSFQNQLHVYGQTGNPCLICGTPIEKIKLKGRGTHFCPHCQKL